MPVQTLVLPLSIAPMIDWSYSHFRVLMRLMAPNALLYTEMVTTGAILNHFHQISHIHCSEPPLALQIGGADKKDLVRCVHQVADIFAEINLNLGCPSDRVQKGHFGACLMKEQALVSDCIKAMKDTTCTPITAKIRIGIDDNDGYDFFYNFAQALIEAGCDKLIIHARKAWLKGLSPKQNRTIPPLHYDYVYRLKQAFPDVPMIINGNITSIEAVQTHLTQVNGVMIGRLACENPYAIAHIHHALYPHKPVVTRTALVTQYLACMQTHHLVDKPLSLILKPIMNMAHGLPNAKYWKKCLLEAQQSKNLALLNQALDWLGHIENLTEDSTDI